MSDKTKVDGKLIASLRTDLLPRKLGIDSLSQKRLGQMISWTVERETGISLNCAARTVQDWEHDRHQPGPLFVAAIRILHARASRLMDKENDKRVWDTYYNTDWKEKFPSLMEELYRESEPAQRKK